MINTFKCKHCARPMEVNFLEYSSNSYCNLCFDERADSKNTDENRLNTFEFMGDVISLEQEPTSSQTNKIMTAEEQFREVIKMARSKNICSEGYSYTEDDIINLQQITTSSQTTSDKWKEYQDWLNEVPELSDEEIEEEIHKRYMTPVQDYAWRDACKWYREQLKQINLQNK